MVLTSKQKKIVKDIHSFVKKKSVIFGKKVPGYSDVFDNHVLSVKNFAQTLARHYKADEFVTVMAAYLHDISYILTFDHDNHEVEGAKFAKKFLRNYDIPEDQIKLISSCILNHRGSKNNKRETMEERIVACADAMDHISRFPHMFYRQSRKKEYDDAVKWMRNKVEMGWNKISLKKARDMVRDKYNLAMKVFS